MGIAAAIIGCIGGITTVLGILSILQVPSEPILSDKLTWGFWFGLSTILLLASIALSMGRKPNGD